MRDLQRSGDAAVVLGVGAHEVGAAADDEVDVLLQPAHVLGLQQRRPDQLPQPLVPEDRDPGVLVRVLEPEEVRLVAGPADLDGVRERLQLAARVEHEVHVRPDGLAHTRDRLDDLGDLVDVPDVQLVGLVAQLLALHGEVRVGGGRVEAAVAVTGGGRGVRGDAGLPATEQRADRRAVRPAREVPQRDVDEAHAHLVELAELTLHVVVDELALQRVLADQVVAEHRDLRDGDRVAADVAADDAVVGVDPDRVGAGGLAAARLVDQREAGRVLGEVDHVELRLVDADPLDLHAAPPPLRAASRCAFAACSRCTTPQATLA